MSFRARMQVAVSKLERMIRLELQRRRLLRHLTPFDTPILIFLDGHTEVHPREVVTHDMIHQVHRYTIPDVLAQQGRHAGYVDGPAHQRRGVRNRDVQMTRLLEADGWTVDRWSYTRPSQRLCTQICDDIQAWFAP